MSTRREKVVKVRFTEAEWPLLDNRKRNADEESCAGYIRRRVLEPELGLSAIAELIGQVGFTLNTLNADPKRLEPLTRILDDLVLEIRKLQSA